MSFRRIARGVGEATLAYIGLAIIPFLSRRAILRTARCLGALAFRIPDKTRRIAFANIDLAYGSSLSQDEKNGIIKSSYQSFALVLLDLFWFARHTKERIRLYVKLDPSSEGVRDVKPSVSVTGHLGNWEIMGQAIALFDPPLLAVASHLKNSMTDRLLGKLRKGGSQMIAYREGAAREAVRILKEGGRVALLLDQNVAPLMGGRFVSFFGVPVSMSSAVERLAIRTGLPVTFAFCIADEDGRYRIYSPPAIMPGEVEHGEGIITQAVARILEDAIRRNPGSWLWMYKRWKYIPPDWPRDKFPFYAKPVKMKKKREAVEI